MSLKILFCFLAICFAAAAQPFKLNSFTTNALGTNLVWDPSTRFLTINGDLNNGGSVNITSNGITLVNIGTIPGFSFLPTLQLASYLNLSGLTNRLTISSGGVLLLDGKPVGGSSITNSGGTLNTLAKFTGTNSIGDSIIKDRTNYVELDGDLLLVTNSIDTGMRFTSDGVMGGVFFNSSGSFADAFLGGHAGGDFTGSTNSSASATQGGGFAGGNFNGSTSSFAEADNGSFSAGYFPSSVSSFTTANNGGYASGDFNGATNSSITVDASVGVGNFTGANGSLISNNNGGVGGGNFQGSTNSDIQVSDGSIAVGYLNVTDSSSVRASVGSIAAGSLYQSQNSIVQASTGGIASGVLDVSSGGTIQVSSGLGFGNLQSSVNSSIYGNSGSVTVGTMQTADSSSITGGNGSIAGGFADASTNAVVDAENGSLAWGVVQNAERLHSVTGSFAFGQDVDSPNPYTWTFGRHFTNSTPDSFAVGFGNTTNFTVRSNAPAEFHGFTPTVNGSPVLTNALGIYRDQSIEAGAMFIGNLASPATTGTYTNTVDDTLSDSWTFADAATNSVRFSLTLPDAWNLGTIKLKLYVTCDGTNTATTTNLVWGVKVGSLGPNEALTNAVFGTEVYVTNGLATNGNVMQVFTTPAITVGGSPATGDSLWFNVLRQGGNAADTWTNTPVRLLKARVQWLESTTAPTSW